MMKKILMVTCLALAAGTALPLFARAQEGDLGALKAEVKALQQKVDVLEKAPAGAAEQKAMDPKYKGFIAVPGSDVIMKFNVKPHLDVTADSGNAGDKQRFVPAKIPVQGDPAKGGGEQFNVNANGSQIRWDIRSPNAAGNPRIYYQNDFFGGSGDMKYRLQHLYGSAYNVVAGYTYGVFEDPDIWPDTVDYEGPNAVNFARRPLVHYKQSLGENWQATYAVEKPDIYVDTTGDDTTSMDSPMPDLGANLRWEKADTGHMQLSAIGRSIGVNSATNGNSNTPGWGLNLGGSYNLTPSDTLLALVNYGEGIGGMGNDSSFANSDAAFDEYGDLEALEYFSGLIGMTHKWSDKWRSTATYGYVDLENTEAQSGDAYKNTTYVSANIVCQVRKQMSIGLEGLYGEKETKDGSSGDVFRVQLGLVYSIF